jgi:ABC-type taurine transport system ATPase subunit
MLNNLSVIDLSSINTTSIQELHQPLAQSVGLAKHLLVNPRLTATTKAVDRDCLR